MILKLKAEKCTADSALRIACRDRYKSISQPMLFSILQHVGDIGACCSIFLQIANDATGIISIIGSVILEDRINYEVILC
ncbi:hypothetical protein D9M70_484850 [compost metagenome]